MGGTRDVDIWDTSCAYGMCTHAFQSLARAVTAYRCCEVPGADPANAVVEYLEVDASELLEGGTRLKWKAAGTFFCRRASAVQAQPQQAAAVPDAAPVMAACRDWLMDMLDLPVGVGPTETACMLKSRIQRYLVSPAWPQDTRQYSPAYEQHVFWVRDLVERLQCGEGVELQAGGLHAALPSMRVLLQHLPPTLGMPQYKDCLEHVFGISVVHVLDEGRRGDAGCWCGTCGA